MSDSIFIGQKMRSFDSAPQFDGFSKVVIQVSDELEYSAGNDSGRTLTLHNPWGTQAMANRILARIKGFQYQPYTANDARLNPAAELGDAVTANNMQGGIFTRRETFGPLMSSTVSAPEDEEIDHEYQYLSKQDRVIKRNMRQLTAELRVQAGLISLEVQERKAGEETLKASIKLESDRITQEVSDRKAGEKDLSTKITTEAGRITTEISDREAADKALDSKITVEAGRITQEVTDRESAINSVNSELTQQADAISARVTKTGGSASTFGWNLDSASWSLKSNNAEVLKATKNGIEIRGKIVATSGKIGGFDILSNYISYNGQTWRGTLTNGIYIGINGIQLGKNFRVDNSGNLYATNGTFTGNVYAKSIMFDDENATSVTYGTLSGGAISAGSIVGGKIADATLGTSLMTDGINTSLGYADIAGGVFGGWINDRSFSADTISLRTINVDSSINLSGSFYWGGAKFQLGTITDGNGKIQNVVRWVY